MIIDYQPRGVCSRRMTLEVEEGVIRDGAFVGDGCAVSQASADMMLDLVIGKETEEALELAKRFFGMIQGTATEMDLEELEDGTAVLANLSLYSRETGLSLDADFGKGLFV